MGTRFWGIGYAGRNPGAIPEAAAAMCRTLATGYTGGCGHSSGTGITPPMGPGGRDGRREKTLDSLGLTPGIIKENITIEGLDFSTIQAGQVLFIGDEVTLEATGPCEPCTRMDEIRDGLRLELDGRRGIVTMVLNGGTLRVGDAVRVEPSREALLEEEAARLGQ